MKNINKKSKTLAIGVFLLAMAGCSPSNVTPGDLSLDSISYPIVDTNQTKFFNNEKEIIAPSKGDSFYGQDAQYQGNLPSYTANGDGTISDNVTGLMWEKSYEVLTYPEALENLEKLNSTSEYSDWRLPSIKELYSLMDFSGIDPIPTKAKDGGTTVVPFIDTEYFDFEYGSNGRRPVDTQLLSSTTYVGKTMGGADTVFGLNVADGRIKGYGTKLGVEDKKFTVRYVRGNEAYGINKFVDNGDTVIDTATNLMWSKEDSGITMNWEEALVWASQMNEDNYLGHSDWRVPNAKELHSILDYSRSPQTTDSAAIDEVFNSTIITVEEGKKDYGFYWTSTTHEAPVGGDAAVYIAFGEALGFFNISKNPESGDNSGEKELVDVHGAGSQRSDPKVGDAATLYPEGDGPQGDVVRIDNLVRLVRDVD